MDAATRAHLLRQLGREREADPEPEPAAAPAGKPASVKVAPRKRQKRARPQPFTITLPSPSEASPPAGPDALRTVHERATAALAQLEGLTVAAPKWAMVSERRAVILAGQDRSAG